MPTYRTSPRHPLEITEDESRMRFSHLVMLLDGPELMGREMIQVVGLEVEPWEVIVKVDNGYQLMRYGWTWVHRDVRPRPSDLSKPKWMLAASTVGSIQAAMSASHSLPIIDGPVEVTDGAKIIRIANQPQE